MSLDLRDFPWAKPDGLGPAVPVFIRCSTALNPGAGPSGKPAELPSGQSAGDHQPWWSADPARGVFERLPHGLRLGAHALWKASCPNQTGRLVPRPPHGVVPKLGGYASGTPGISSGGCTCDHHHATKHRKTCVILVELVPASAQNVVLGTEPAFRPMALAPPGLPRPLADALSAGADRRPVSDRQPTALYLAELEAIPLNYGCFPHRSTPPLPGSRLDAVRRVQARHLG